MREYFQVNEVLQFVPKEIEIIDVIEKTSANLRCKSKRGLVFITLIYLRAIRTRDLPSKLTKEVTEDIVNKKKR